jgi:glycosyltransferase involved in cell wall biosynthesis
VQEKFSVIYNGVDLDKFQPQRDGGEIRKELGIPENRTVIGHVGRFHRAKNHAVILKSFARLRAEMNNVHLLLVGDGDIRDEIERAIRELEIEDRVTLAGRRKNVPAVLGAMDVYFFPSMYEGMPNALIEAMACGLPIVASDIEEVLEVVPGEMRQQLLAPTDFEGLAGALKRLCLDPEARKELGALARRHVEQHFSLQVSAEKLCRYWTMDL